MSVKTMEAIRLLVALHFMFQGQLNLPLITSDPSFVEEFVFSIKPIKEVAIYDRIGGSRVEMTHDGYSPFLVQVERDGWLQLRFGSYVVWSKKANFVLTSRSSEFFETRIKSNPDDAWALSMKGAYWVLNKSPYLARSNYTQCIQKDAKYVAAYTGRAKAWLDSEYYKLAMEDCDEALRLDPKNNFAHCIRGKVWIARKKYDQAIEELNQAIRIDPKESGAYTSRGLSWVSLKQYQKAIADFNEAFRLNPFDELAFSNRSMTRELINDYITAIQEYDEALRLDPGNWKLLGLRGHFWHLHRKYDQAIEDLNESIRLDPENFELFLERGNVWRSKKDLENAIQNYDAAIRLAPRNSNCFIARGNARLAFREQGAAIQDFDEAIRLAPKAPTGIIHRGIALISDRPQEAVAQFQKFQNLSGLKKDPLAPCAAIYGYFAAKRAGEERTADQFLKVAADLLTEKSWPFPMLQLLRGEIEEADLLKKVVNDDVRREAEFFLALNHGIHNRKNRSNEHYRWLLEHSNPTKIEFCLAMAELHEVKRVSQPADHPKRETIPGL